MTKARNIADLGSNDVIETSATGVDVTGTVTADGLTVQTAQGDINVNSSASDLEFTRAGTNYIRATDSAGEFRFVTGADDFSTVRLNVSSGGDVSFYEDTGTTAKMVWDASTERLGIGGSPSATLEIMRTNATGNPDVPTLRFRDLDASSAAGQKAGQIEFYTSDTSPNSAGVHSFINGQTENTSGVGALVFGTGQSGSATEAMRIDSSGNVGIGAASPSEKLDINGGLNYPKIKIQASTQTSRFMRLGMDNATEHSIEANGSSTSLLFKTVGTERARIDSAGNLLVGKTAIDIATSGTALRGTISSIFTVDGTLDDQVAIFNRTSSDGDILRFDKDGSTVGSIGTTSAGNFAFYSPSEGGLETAAVGILPMMAGVRADNQTDLGFSGARFKDLYLSGAAYLQNSTGGSGGLRLKNPSNNTNAKIATFTGWNNTETGNISTYVNVTSYNTSSDYRLKEDIVELPTATDDVMSLKPCNFAWKGTESRMNGFIAHELAEIVPEAVTGEKDAMRTEEYEVTPAVLDDNGNVVTEAVIGTREVPEYQSIDQSKLVPLLTKALQEAITKIEQLETRIETLENN